MLKKQSLNWGQSMSYLDERLGYFIGLTLLVPSCFLARLQRVPNSFCAVFFTKFSFVEILEKMM